MSHACGGAVSTAQRGAGSARPSWTRRAGIGTASTAAPTLPVSLAERRLTRVLGRARRSGRITVETPGTRPLIRPLIRALCGGGPRLLFGALRRAGPRPHPHRSGTVRRTPPTQRTSPPGCLPRHGVRCGTHRVSVSGARTGGIRGRRDALRGTATGSGRFLERVARKLSTYPVESGARLLPQCSRITPAVVSGRAKGGRGERES